MIVEEAITSEILEAVERLYCLREPPEVRRFLSSHSFLIPLVFQAHDRIGSYFAPLQFTLQVIAEPESVNDQQLVLFMAVDLSPAEALARLQQFDNDWWLDAMDEAKGKLCISLEFR
ncbi:MAG TPA: hypothetical protein VJH03_00110 [Blastocatellia bacterium]|nr:hypothetical protein [Blastocatellia bacterium]